MFTVFVVSSLLWDYYQNWISDTCLEAVPHNLVTFSTIIIINCDAHLVIVIWFNYDLPLFFFLLMSVILHGSAWLADPLCVTSRLSQGHIDRLAFEETARKLGHQLAEKDAKRWEATVGVCACVLAGVCVCTCKRFS